MMKVVSLILVTAVFSTLAQAQEKVIAIVENEDTGSFLSVVDVEGKAVLESDHKVHLSDNLRLEFRFSYVDRAAQPPVRKVFRVSVAYDHDGEPSYEFSYGDTKKTLNASGESAEYAQSSLVRGNGGTENPLLETNTRTNVVAQGTMGVASLIVFAYPAPGVYFPFGNKKEEIKKVKTEEFQELTAAAHIPGAKKKPGDAVLELIPQTP